MVRIKWDNAYCLVPDKLGYDKNGDDDDGKERGGDKSDEDKMEASTFYLF